MGDGSAETRRRRPLAWALFGFIVVAMVGAAWLAGAALGVRGGGSR